MFDRNDINKMLKRYEKMIHKIVHKYYKVCVANGLPYEYDDLYQIGLEAFVRAVNGFDESRGSKFSTYLYNSVRNSMFVIFKNQTDTKTVETSDSFVEDCLSNEICDNAELVESKIFVENVLKNVLPRLDFDEQICLILYLYPPDFLIREFQKSEHKFKIRSKKKDYSSVRRDRFNINTIAKLLGFSNSEIQRLIKKLKTQIMIGGYHG